MKNIRQRIWLYAGTMLLATFWTGASIAQDVVVTRQQTYRGRVQSVTADGIQFEISGVGVINIPRGAVVQMQVAPPPSITRGIAAYERGNIREARQSLDRIVFQYQGLDLDWAMKGLAYFGRAALLSEDFQNAERAFNVFMQAYPDSSMAVDARLGLVEIELQKKNFDTALETLREMAEVYDRQLKPPAEQLPLSAGVYMAIGQALEGLQQPEEAEQAYLRVIALYPDPRRYPEALYRCASLMAARQQPSKAAMLLDELIENYPTHSLNERAVELRNVVAAEIREDG
ncbi:MAG: tol-pal system YbgF family protein [Kiritimatiellia bacterium]|nr:tetratricopeptide repeat protein [Lentisphaerota bacterium]